MLQPKKEKKKSLIPRGVGETIEERTQARKRDFNYKQEKETHSLGNKITRTSKIEKRPIPQLKTKKATPVTTSPLNNERVAQSFAKPKMKTLKGKIQLALMKAKKG